MKDIISHCDPQINSPSELAALTDQELDREATRLIREIDCEMEKLEAYRMSNRERRYSAEFVAVEEEYKRRASDLFDGFVEVNVVRDQLQREASLKEIESFFG